jgi:acylphosphatase
MKKQIHVIYSGKVQGVGFRFTTVDLAEKMNISGWVSNLSDGTVEIMAEAEEQSLLEFLENLQRIFNRYIREKNIEWLKATDTFQEFRIKR